MKKHILWASSGLLLPLVTSCGGPSEAKQPNIIYIMCDDLGYNKLNRYIPSHRT